MTSGRMALHGYTVDHGWFNGTCTGSQHGPIEVDREQADRVVADVRAEVVQLRGRIEALRNGTATLELVPNPDLTGNAPPLVQFATIDARAQRAALDAAITRMTTRAWSGDTFVQRHAAVVEQVHGLPLRKVPARTEPGVILEGEQRAGAHGGVLTASYIDRGRIRWADDGGRRGSMATRSWRQLKLLKAGG